MNNLQELIGHKVVVYSVGASLDTHDLGVVESFDGTFVKLRTDRDVLYFPVYSIRAIKVSEKP